MEVVKKGDASAGEDDPSQERGSDQWLQYLKDDAVAVLQSDSDAILSVWSIQEIQRLAHLLNLSTTVSERTSWDGMPEGWAKKPLATLPHVTVSFSPQVRVQNRLVSWAVRDLNL